MRETTSSETRHERDNELARHQRVTERGISYRVCESDRESRSERNNETVRTRMNERQRTEGSSAS